MSSTRLSSAGSDFAVGGGGGAGVEEEDASVGVAVARARVTCKPVVVLRAVEGLCHSGEKVRDIRMGAVGRSAVHTIVGL